MRSRLSLVLLGGLLTSCAGTSFRAPQEVDWFPGGLYGGGMYGVVDHTSSAEDVDEELAKRGYTTTTSFDNDDSAYEAFIGYRFSRPFGVELSYVNLGEVESVIAANPPDINVFLEDVADVHPVLGRGVQLEGRWFAWNNEDLELSLSAGLWLWEADVDARAATGQRGEGSPDDLDPTFGAAATFGLRERWDLRAAWDRFYLDGDAADAFWIGVQARLL